MKLKNFDHHLSPGSTPAQLEDAWNQVKDRFRECPTWHQDRLHIGFR